MFINVFELMKIGNGFKTKTSEAARALHHDQFRQIRNPVVVSQIAALLGDNTMLPQLCDNEVLRDSNKCIKRSLHYSLFCALNIL